ncbi:MAG: amidohydrolase family protein [Nitrospinota bacterium]
MDRSLKHFSIPFKIFIGSAEEIFYNGVAVINEGRIEKIYTNNIPDNIPPLICNARNNIVHPGFVNSHTHLELSFLKNQISTRAPFPDWIESLVLKKRVTPKAVIEDKMKDAIKSLYEARTIAIGDISSEQIAFGLLSNSMLKGTIFYELLGLDDSKLDAKLVRLKENVAQKSKRLIGGISPHSLYSSSLKLLKESYQLASNENIPFAIHLAESQEETEYIKYGRGEFVDMFARLKLKDSYSLNNSNLDPLELLDHIGCMDKSILIHMNYPSENFKKLLNRKNNSIIWSPGANNWFKRVTKYPIVEYLNLGVNISLGTDGLGSNNSLDIRREAILAKNSIPSLSYKKLFKLITENGAVTLQNKSLQGKLYKNGPFDAVVIHDVDDKIEDIFEFILTNETNSFSLFIDGMQVYQKEIK